MDWEIRTAYLLLGLTVLLATIQHGDAERKIVCYYTNWSVYRPGTAKFSPQNINPYLCTHLIYAFGGFTKDNTLKPFDKYQDIEKGGYAKFTGLKTYNKNLKTMLAIGGWNEGSSRFSPMVADAGRRREFVKNSIKFLRLNHFDGLDLDWEYPAFRDGGKPRDKDNYANLVQELREEFEREASKTGRPRLLLSMAMPAGIEYIDKGYDVPRLNEYLDFINLLSYDYHSAYEPAVNHHSPLYPLEEDNEYNYDTELTIDYTISHLFKKGASPDKVILGIPTYGRSYTLFNEDATDLGSPADGPGVEGEATREKGYLAYYEICEEIEESDDWEVVQPNPSAMGPYAVKGNQWVGYDDEDIVRLKAKYVNEKSLGGIMFWSIDNDDFRGKCHGRAYPLIEAAKEALLTASAKSTGQKSKSVDVRKKSRPQGFQSNTIGRKLGSSSRRSTTVGAPTSRKRTSSPRPRYQTISRTRSSNEDEEEEDEDKTVDRRSYEPSSSEEEQNEGGNAVRTLEKNERDRSKPKIRTKGRAGAGRNRRKQSRRKEKVDSEEESLSNKLTTPEPPTTPDPGSDFKCEDEGFFSHPRDCKKYFWCLDSGPGGLGVVAHQFTCPSGLVFNKAADSCDYPRNVICPKAKASQSTTRAPITAATSRTTYLHSTTKRPTTERSSSSEEYESYEDEDEIEDEEEEVDEEEVEEKQPPRVTSTPRPLLYKTINRSRPSTTTSTVKPEGESVKLGESEDEEDPRVLKELIDLIKKAGGIEQLEKQLLFQDKGPDTTADNEQVTPATISRTLYERVLSRQANRIAAGQRPAPSSGKTSYANGPGGAQFEGLDDVPEVKSLRRSQKPQYVTIERPKSSTKEPPVEDEEEDEDEDEEEEFESDNTDNTDVASSEERTVSNPFLRSSTQRVTPNYVNIRRARPSTTTSRTDNDVEEKEEVEAERPARRRRPFTSKSRDDEANSESPEPARKRISLTRLRFRYTESTKSADHAVETDDSNEETPTTKSRYVSIHRFRSTTSRSSDDTSTETSRDEPTLEPITESIKPSEAPETTTISTSTASSPLPTQITGTISQTESTESVSSVSTVLEGSSTTDPVRLVEDSATEILLTTVPASYVSPSNPGSTLANVSEGGRTTIGAATVSQPRPFGFARRSRPVTSDGTTTPLAPSSAPSTAPSTAPSSSGAKIASLEAVRLPTLKELVGYPKYVLTSTSEPVQLNLLHGLTGNDVSLQNVVDADFSPRENDESTSGNDAGVNNDRVYGERIADANNVENSIAGTEDEDRTSKRRKTRIDHGGSSSSTIRPTTMRGAPLASLTTPSPVSRGFYLTKSNNGTTSLTRVTSAGVTESNAAETSDESNAKKVSWQVENDEISTTARDEKIGELYAFDTKTTTEMPDETYATRTVGNDVGDSMLTYSTVGKEYLERFSTTTDVASTLLNEATGSPVKKFSGETTREVSTVNVEVKRHRTTTEIPVSVADRGRSRNRSRNRGRGRGRARYRSRSRTEIPTREETFDPRVEKDQSSSSTTITASPLTSIPRSTIESTISTSSTETANVIPASSEKPVASTDVTTEFSTDSVALSSNSFVLSTEKYSTYGTRESSDAETTLEFASENASSAFTTVALAKETGDKSSSISRTLETTESVAAYSTPRTSHSSSTALNTDDLPSAVTSDLRTETTLPTIHESTASESTTVPTFPSSTRQISTTTYRTSNVTPSSSLPSIVPRTSSSDSSTAAVRPTAVMTTIEESLAETTREETAIASTTKKFARRRQRIRPTASSYEFGWKTGRRRTAVERERQPGRGVNVYRGREKEREREKEKGSDDREANEMLDREDREKEERPRDPLWVQDPTTPRPVTEVDPSNNSSSSARKPSGVTSSSRLRKPAPISSSTLQNRSSNTNQRKIRPTDERHETKVTTGVTEQTEVSDQSIRAQELAVTLADPPTPQASGTGRLPLRDALRRKISTTIAPRTDATTSRTTLRQRQRPKTWDRPVENVTTRPRRPAVIDYDYYEDEEEPVVGKSTFNGKLFLTSKGTVRCLDQGNFPHPYSCKKFITCARMVDGQVIGAEYTCPDKLSFDPVGGICNWSAGLGCKE